MKWLCKIGLHSWKLSAGLLYSIGGYHIIAYRRICRKCGKSEPRSFLL